MATDNPDTTESEAGDSGMALGYTGRSSLKTNKHIRKSASSAFTKPRVQCSAPLTPSAVAAHM